ncbi:MAG: hypothetical protein CVV23_04835 [Ignavibacteriae bacterium HGW-Ignavibacteriae-2]|nr:MAG: hypothetical protein CVV23_04835 [Ignavibacteriae bacterium HGW-Ignavibacteriae-2]
MLYYIIERNDGYTTWEQIFTTTSVSYIDNEVDINSVFEDVIQYRVKARINSTTTSGNTNVAWIDNAVLNKEKQLNSQNLLTSKNNSILFETYPNPFNPSTNISYSIRANNFVSLKVYDSIGKEVAELVNEIQGAGNYTIPFDGRNLSSGVYYYVLSTPNYWKVKKMLLIR